MENEAVPLLEGIRAFLRELYPGKCYEIRVSTTKLYPERLEVSIIRHPEEDWADPGFDRKKYEDGWRC